MQRSRRSCGRGSARRERARAVPEDLRRARTSWGSGWRRSPKRSAAGPGSDPAKCCSKRRSRTAIRRRHLGNRWPGGVRPGAERDGDRGAGERGSSRRSRGPPAEVEPVSARSRVEKRARAAARARDDGDVKRGYVGAFDRRRRTSLTPIGRRFVVFAGQAQLLWRRWARTGRSSSRAAPGSSACSRGRRRSGSTRELRGSRWTGWRWRRGAARGGRHRRRYQAGLVRFFAKSALLVGPREGLGWRGRAFEIAREYCEGRRAFGKPIGHFQAVAFTRSRDRAMDVDAGRRSWRAAYAWDAKRPESDALLRTAQAVAFTHEAAMRQGRRRSAPRRGGVFMRDYPVEKLMR